MTKKTKKVKEMKIDGLNASDLKNLRRATRQVWSWSKSWRIAKNRTIGADGFPRCENPKCDKRGKPVPHVAVDHIFQVGDVMSPNYLARLMVPSDQLQTLCKKCHDAKTKDEKRTNKPKRSTKSFI